MSSDAKKYAAEARAAIREEHQWRTIIGHMHRAVEALVAEQEELRAALEARAAPAVPVAPCLVHGEGCDLSRHTCRTRPSNPAPVAPSACDDGCDVRGTVWRHSEACEARGRAVPAHKQATAIPVGAPEKSPGVPLANSVAPAVPTTGRYEAFLALLQHGGVIVSSSAFSPQELATARANDRMLVLADGTGCVYYPHPRKPTTDLATARAALAKVEGERDAAARILGQWDTQCGFGLKMLPDHTCGECVPDSPIVRPGFLCAKHATFAYLSAHPTPAKECPACGGSGTKWVRGVPTTHCATCNGTGRRT